MSRTHFHLTYDGPALATHEMSARDLAPALIAVSDLLEQANLTLNGERARVAVTVKASFRTGCFGIDFGVAQDVGRFLRMFTGEEAVGAVNLLTILGFTGAAGVSLLGLLKRLRGRPIQEIQPLKNGNFRVIVESDSVDVEEAVINLLRNYQLRRALEDVVKPLQRDGIETVAVQESLDAEPLVISKPEAAWFAAPPPQDELLEENESILLLQLVSISFKEDNKWRFSDGSTTFYAAMLDDRFQRRVDADEVRFAKNDILKVRLRRSQYLDTAGNMRTEAHVTEVMEHRPAGHQLKLPISPPRDE